MARGIYEIKLKERYFPALCAEDAMEMQLNDECRGLRDEDVEVTMVIKEEHTIKLFLLAKTMYDTEKFEYNEIEAAICALAREMGYYGKEAEVTNCVTTWVERIAEDMTPGELEEWLIG